MSEWNNPYHPPESDLVRDSAPAPVASIWRRAAAWVIDEVIHWFGIPLLELFAMGLVTVALLKPGEEAGEVGRVLGERYGCLMLLFFLVQSWVVRAAMEASRLQATFGKLLLGLQVVDLEGCRIGFARATGRHFGKVLGQAILGIGYAVAFWSDRSQALHDLMAGTLVVRKR